MPKSILIHDLYWCRAARNLTQAELAHRAGVSLRTIGKIEAGRCNPCPTTVARVAKALRIPQRQLQGG